MTVNGATLMSIGQSRPWARFCVTVLCVALFVTRLSGAHLHVCLDGSEVPESVQLTNVGSNDWGDGTPKARHDLDLSLAGEAAGKKLDGTLALPVQLAADTVLFVLKNLDPHMISSRGMPPSDATYGFRLRPPLRAPPC